MKHVAYCDHPNMEHVSFDQPKQAVHAWTVKACSEELFMSCLSVGLPPSPIVIESVLYLILTLDIVQHQSA